MAKDYMKLLSTYHPGVGATCNEDSTVYANITWHDPAVTQATLDSEYLAYKKQERYDEIDYKTGTLIAPGFAYDSYTFSASLAAQSNWNVLKDEEPEFTWPVEVSTIDNNSYDLQQANLDGFWTAGRDAVKGNLDSGRALKKSIFDAIDEAGVDAVVDTR